MIPLQSIKNIAFPTKTKEKRMRNSLHSCLYPLFCQKVYHFNFINTGKEKNRAKRNPKCRAGMSHGPLSYIAFVSLYLFLCILIGSGTGDVAPSSSCPGHCIAFCFILFAVVLYFALRLGLPSESGSVVDGHTGTRHGRERLKRSNKSPRVVL